MKDIQIDKFPVWVNLYLPFDAEPQLIQQSN
jgi:hypothetical protein